MGFFDDLDTTSPCFATPSLHHGRGNIHGPYQGYGGPYQGYGHGDVRKQQQMQRLRQQRQMEAIQRQMEEEEKQRYQEHQMQRLRQQRYQEQQMRANYARQNQCQMEEEEKQRYQRQRLMQPSNPFGFQRHRRTRSRNCQEGLIRQQRHKAAVEKQRRHAAGRLRLTNASRKIQRAFRAHQRRSTKQKHAAATVIQEWFRARRRDKAARVIARAMRGFPLITQAMRQLQALKSLARLAVKVSVVVQDHAERLESASASKQQELSWKYLEDDLMRVQLAVDSCAAHGSDFVRQRRKAVICLAQRHIDAIDKELALLEQNEQEMEI